MSDCGDTLGPLPDMCQGTGRRGNRIISKKKEDEEVDRMEAEDR